MRCRRERFGLGANRSRVAARDCRSSIRSSHDAANAAAHLGAAIRRGVRGRVAAIAGNAPAPTPEGGFPGSSEPAHRRGTRQAIAMPGVTFWIVIAFTGHTASQAPQRMHWSWSIQRRL